MRLFSGYYLHFACILIFLINHMILLGNGEQNSGCNDSNCSDIKERKKKIREKVIKKLQYPGSTAPAKSKLEEIQSSKKEEPSQIRTEKINNYFSFIQKIIGNKSIKNLLLTPHIIENHHLLSSLPEEDGKATKYPHNIIPRVKFQRTRRALLKYLTQVKHSVDEFWYLVKKLLIDDREVLEVLKWGKTNLCHIEQPIPDEKILQLSNELNYSPLGYNDKMIYYIDKTISIAGCKHLKQYRISIKNKMCTNLAILSLLGYCRINTLAEKINACISPASELTSPKCKNFSDVLARFEKINKLYVKYANYILINQILPAYFSTKLVYKMSSDISNPKVLYHNLYTHIIEEWLENSINIKESMLSLKRERAKDCGMTKDITTYIDEIIKNIDTYVNLSSNIDKTRTQNIAVYMSKLPAEIHKLIQIITLPQKWKFELSVLLYDTLTVNNAECLFKTIKTILSTIYNSSNYFIEIKLEDLIYGLDTTYKIYAFLSELTENNFSLKNLLATENTPAKFEEFFTLDYRLSLLYMNYTMKKCSGSIDTPEKFIENLSYSKNQSAILKCLIKNKGNIIECNNKGIFDAIIYLLSKINIPNFNLGDLTSAISEMSKYSDNERIIDVVKEYHQCCNNRKCSIPQHCDSNEVKKFCKECYDFQQREKCSEIEETIKECCFNGEIQQIKDNRTDTGYDPCKLGYKLSEKGEYKWEYPEFRCSVGRQEQKKCYQLLLNTIGGFQILLKYLLQDNEGNFDSGKTFCQNPKGKLAKLCCDSIKICNICQNTNFQLCKLLLKSLIESRKLYEKNLEEIFSKSFLEIIRKKITTYIKNGFSEHFLCIEAK